MISIKEADAYIAVNCIDIGEWSESDEARKQRIINVASRTLTAKYPQYKIPDAAVYEFSNELAIAFNDTNKLQQHGIAAFSIKNLSYAFRDGEKSSLEGWIPQSVWDIIGAKNGVKLGIRQVKWTVL